MDATAARFVAAPQKGAKGVLVVKKEIDAAKSRGLLYGPCPEAGESKVVHGLAGNF